MKWDQVGQVQHGISTALSNHWYLLNDKLYTCTVGIQMSFIDTFKN